MRKRGSRPDTAKPVGTAPDVPEAKPSTEVLPQETASAPEKNLAETLAARMAEAARFKAAIATAFIEQREELLRHGGNPMHIWHAYLLSRQGGVSIPDWVLSYFDAVAHALTGTSGANSPQATARALGLATKGGPSKARLAKIDERHLDIVNQVLLLVDSAVRQDRSSGRRGGLTLQDRLVIMERVADEHGLSVERVQQIYYNMGSTDGRLEGAAGTTGQDPPTPTDNGTDVKQPRRRTVRPSRRRRINS